MVVELVSEGGERLVVGVVPLDGSYAVLSP
jgi:hypothetical protein